MLEAGLYSLLAGETMISDLVADRITPVRLPIGSPMPALTYRIIGGASSPTFETSGMQRVRIQFDAFGDTHVDAATLRDVVRKFLNGFRGALSDGKFVQSFDLIQAMDFDEQYSREYRCMLEMYCMFTFSG
jgi:hypothetical protein